MSGKEKTPGQRAYEAYRDELGGDRPWSDVRQPERDTWEAAAAAGAAPAHARTAELAGELNAVRADRDRLYRLLAEAVDPTAQDYDNAAEILRLRDLVAEILREVELGTLGQHTPAATTQTLARTAQWRQRAGLAIVTAGTEHLVELAGDGEGA